ncbi:MAG: hemerythrin [Desulfobulbaceae bacterium]|nr:MAG: hemerythrin [Desulfobulbaceae bacterium]
MAMFAWKPEYSVNIKEIDDQHKQLVAMVNELHEAMTQKKGKEVLGPILAKLINYTATHFAAEEKLMQQHGYPDYDKHKAKHEKMVQKVLALQNDYKGGKITMTFEVSKFLQDWLNKHILGTDKQYSAFLNDKGVS